MPIIKSAKKRISTAQKAAVRNLRTRRTAKAAVKSVRTAAKSGKKSVGKEYSEAISALDTAVKKGVIHKNKAARLKSRLSGTVKKSGAKVTGVATRKTASKAKTAKSGSKTKKTAAKKKPAKK